VTLLTKSLTGLAGVCSLGLIWALAEVVAQAPVRAAQAARLPSAAPNIPLPAPNRHAQQAVAPNWVFTLRSNAIDDPETARSVSAGIVFEGVTDTCQDPHPRAQFGLAIDRTGTSAAHARREQRVCLPACDGRPPATSVRPLARHLDLTAYQEQFDRAHDQYAPEGRIASVQWVCSGRTYRLVAASVVALACNSEECDDVQVANAAVQLSYESGRSLDEPQATFVLRGLGAGTVVASATATVGPR
jgi:hypothetical protein